MLLSNQLNNLIKFVYRYFNNRITFIRLEIKSPAVGNQLLTVEELILDGIGISFFKVVELFFIVVADIENSDGCHVEQNVFLRCESAELLEFTNLFKKIQSLINLFVFNMNNGLNQVVEEEFTAIERNFCADISASSKHLFRKIYLIKVGVDQRF